MYSLSYLSTKKEIRFAAYIIGEKVREGKTIPVQFKNLFIITLF